MLVELSLIPVGGDIHSSGALARALELVDRSGLPYQLTPSGTCIEGEWDEVMALVRQCHDSVRQTRPHVVTIIKIEDDAGEHGKLSRNVASVGRATAALTRAAAAKCHIWRASSAC
jgi:uncharacterized protein (TIGR00106 family)